MNPIFLSRCGRLPENDGVGEFRLYSPASFDHLILETSPTMEDKPDHGTEPMPIGPYGRSLPASALYDCHATGLLNLTSA